jgi:hypothetical protein
MKPIDLSEYGINNLPEKTPVASRPRVNYTYNGFFGSVATDLVRSLIEKLKRATNSIS